MLPPDVACITLATPFAIGAVNAWLLEGDPLTLVDPGPNVPEAREGLERGLAERGHRLEDVEQVLLTHQHHDHVGLAGWVRERSGAEVAAIAPLAEFLADFEHSMDQDDAYAVAAMLRHGVEPDVARELNGVSRSWRGVGAGVHVDRVLEPGEDVVAGGRSLSVLVRPGHSPTDTLFHDARDGLLVGGDHLLLHVSSNPVAHWPPGNRDPRALAASPDRPRPLRDYLDSLSRTGELEVSVVLPGHGKPFADHRDLIAGRQNLHSRRAQTIFKRIEGRPTAVDVGRALWRRIPVTQAFLVLSEVLGHVDLLEAEGRVREVEDDDGVVRLERVE